MVQPSPVVFWGVNFAFLFSGISQNLLAFKFVELGFGKDSSNYINAMGNPVGQLLFALPDVRSWRNWNSNLMVMALPIVFLDLGFNLFSQISIAKIGSGMYQVIYSFVVVLNALLGRCLLRKKLGWRRWLTLLIIFGAVVFSAAAQLNLKGTDVSTTFLGILFAILATIFVSVIYVMVNWLLERPWERSAPKPLVLAQMLGVAEVSVIAVYFSVHVVPRWHEAVSGNMKPGASTLAEDMSLYVAYLLICGVHQYAFYYACAMGPAGAVTAGVNKCLQTAILFFLSDLFFCSSAPSQCLSVFKVVGAVFVCLGVVLYGLFVPKQEEASAVPTNSGTVSLMPVAD